MHNTMTVCVAVLVNLHSSWSSSGVSPGYKPKINYIRKITSLLFHANLDVYDVCI